MMNHWLLIQLIRLTVAVVILTAAGCVSDPMGATTRERIRADAHVAAVEAEARAKSEAARWAAEAKIEEARQERIAAQSWAQTLPTVAAILGAAVAVWLVIVYRGRAHVILAERGLFSPSSPDPRVQLHHYAARYGQQVVEREGLFYLVDGETGRVAKRLLLKGADPMSHKF